MIRLAAQEATLPGANLLVEALVELGRARGQRRVDAVPRAAQPLRGLPGQHPRRRGLRRGGGGLARGRGDRPHPPHVDRGGGLRGPDRGGRRARRARPAGEQQPAGAGRRHDDWPATLATLERIGSDGWLAMECGLSGPNRRRAARRRGAPPRPLTLRRRRPWDFVRCTHRTRSHTARGRLSR
ncbi:MAG: hypothetical protein AVDCRST_MAG48-654 [uncultured Friedmanniella sp.]|uniref:Uncharacterized protein n=1 Tax=uncultured Friedmanniella sp. TaxID=335381 RepID=A0A6J4K161_9ACTN|nr:MAG: hypothetical protein AVDCRST_MAG48-654 [uncultured Friedmanniella sp.]